MYLRGVSLIAKISQAVQQNRCLCVARHMAQINRPHTNSQYCVAIRSFSSSTKPDDKQRIEIPTAAPQILSKLFPQTSGPIESEEKRKEEQQRKEEEEKKEQANSWKRMKYGFYLFGAVVTYAVGLAVYELGSPERDIEGNIIEDKFSKLPLPEQYLKRMWKSMAYFQKIIQEPSREKLLPDPLKPPYYQPKYTLVLELKDVLVHPDWTYQTGWRFKKRPAVDTFLEQLAADFEIVVFTAEQGMTVFPILDALDPKGYIMYRLVRDATHFVDGHHVKNLDNLNRDLSKVIVVDWNPNSTKMHPENTLNIERWLGNDDDLQLLDLVAFLKTVSSAGVDDVRAVLQYYGQFDNPLAQFRENQRILAQQLHEKELEEQAQPPSVAKRWTPSFLGRK